MRKGTQKRSPNGAAARFFAAALALCVWQAGAMALGNELLLVTPAAVARRLCELIATADFWATLGFTFSRISLGFLLALRSGTGGCPGGSRRHAPEQTTGHPAWTQAAHPGAAGEQHDARRGPLARARG